MPAPCRRPSEARLGPQPRLAAATARSGPAMGPALPPFSSFTDLARRAMVSKMGSARAWGGAWRGVAGRAWRCGGRPALAVRPVRPAGGTMPSNGVTAVSAFKGCAASQRGEPAGLHPRQRRQRGQTAHRPRPRETRERCLALPHRGAARCTHPAGGQRAVQARPSPAKPCARSPASNPGTTETVIAFNLSVTGRRRRRARQRVPAPSARGQRGLGGVGRTGAPPAESARGEAAGRGAIKDDGQRGGGGTKRGRT